MANSYKKTLFLILITFFLSSSTLHPANDVTHKDTAISRLISNSTVAWKKFWTWTGLKYMSYKTERNIIGPFFVPHNERIYLVVLTRNEIVDKTRVEIGGDNNIRPFYRKLPFKKNYTVLKKDVTNFLGKTYNITPSNRKNGKKETITGSIPKPQPKDTDYSFLFYGDLRKRDPGWLHKIKNSHEAKTSITYKTGRTVKKEKDERLHLLTGDLVIDGGSVQEWVEFLDKVLRPATKDTLITSAIGNHDISSSMIMLKKKVYFWLFNNTAPHFGNLFYFKQEKEKLSVREHIEKTQGYFDVGAVRFVHLPLPTENTSFHYLESPIGKIKGFPRSPLLYKGQLSCYNFNPKIYEEFERNILLAHAAKLTGKIKFIIVYGHAPLVSSPGYSHSRLAKLKKYSWMHQGIINFMIDNEKKFANKKSGSDVNFKKYVFAKNIKRIFEKYSIDAYFCGHNHIYDRCTWKINEETSIPMVTMAVGTKLLRLLKIKNVSPALKENIKSEKIIHRGHPKEEFIGFISCAVDPGKKVINCSLVGEDDSGTDSEVFDTFEIVTRD